MAASVYCWADIGREPKLSCFYIGWTGQRICFHVHSAVFQRDAGCWRQACREFARLLALTGSSGVLEMPGEGPDGVAGSLAELEVHLAEDGGWWTAPGGYTQRHPDEAAAHARQQAIEKTAEELPFVPLLDEKAGGCLVAEEIHASLASAVAGMAALLGQQDACRHGVMLAGLCYRATKAMPVRALVSTLDGLAGLDMIDLARENALRRHLGLTEVAVDRSPVLVQNLPGPDPAEMGTRRSRLPAFSPDLVAFPPEHLVLAVVFDRFGVEVPPTVADQAGQGEAGIKKQVRQRAANAAMAELVQGSRSAGPRGGDLPERLHTKEAIEYLGLDRRGLARPEMALQRMVKAGALRPVKVGGRNVYKREELDRILQDGDPPKRRRRRRQGE